MNQQPQGGPSMVDQLFQNNNAPIQQGPSQGFQQGQPQGFQQQGFVPQYQPHIPQTQQNPTGQVGGTSIMELRKQAQMQEIINKQPHEPSDSDRERDKIRFLVKDINKSLDDYGPSKMQNTDDSDSENNSDTQDDIESNNDTKSSYITTHMLKEMFLIIIIYVVLSQAFIRKNIGKYITYINPDENGMIPIFGYAIYGAFLAAIFVLCKKILRMN